VFVPSGSHFTCVELAPGVTREQVVERTDADVTFDVPIVVA
jgi:acyl CoA:acetate/3-ketoacid CoA transferase beta subunit